MDAETKKKLIIPFVIFVALVALNINTIVNGIKQHNTNRVVIASVSCVLVFVFFVVVLRSANRGGNKGI